VTMERKRRSRSIQQNRYYWGVVVEMIHRQLIDDGWEASKEDVHEMLKAKYNIKELYNETTGEVMQTVRSTTDLSTTEFEAYNESCKRWAAETIGLVIPDPQQYEFEL